MVVEGIYDVVQTVLLYRSIRPDGRMRQDDHKGVAVAELILHSWPKLAVMFNGVTGRCTSRRSPANERNRFGHPAIFRKAATDESIDRDS
jgi:hypothetical protein